VPSFCESINFVSLHPILLQLRFLNNGEPLEIV